MKRVILQTSSVIKYFPSTNIDRYEHERLAMNMIRYAYVICDETTAFYMTSVKESTHVFLFIRNLFNMLQWTDAMHFFVWSVKINNKK